MAYTLAVSRKPQRVLVPLFEARLEHDATPGVLQQCFNHK